jgi:lipopolysaccharide/colanic/teichoic acid biosynthesis glycosyltransferase
MPGHRFAFGLLAYLVLSVLTFALVWRYTREIAYRVGGIDQAWLQFGIYGLIYVVLISGVILAIRRLPLGLSREWQLRLAFLAGATLSFAFAFYQARFGTGLSATYFTVGLLGTFATVLAATGRTFGLVEVVARPSAQLIAEVERAHAGMVLAEGLWDRAKRLLELLLSVLLILVSLPISVPLSMAVWWQDPGPLLIAKVAVMRGGRSFNQLKLRSMVKNAEGRTGPVPAAPDDRRITRLGSFLRRTHIDELPQMINIARGEMSLVGPRPERTVFVHRHLQTISGYARRHAVRPGLAGLAQVYGDYYSTPREKLRYDLLYIRRRSFGLDVKLFGAAVLIALLGIHPTRRRPVHRLGSADCQDRRWQRAYAALRGDAAPVTPDDVTSDDRPGDPA